MTEDNFDISDPIAVPFAIDLAGVPIVCDVTIAAGFLDENGFSCQCGDKHANAKFIIFELGTGEGTIKFITFEGSQFFDEFIQGNLDEAARAVLAKLELRGL